MTTTTKGPHASMREPCPAGWCLDCQASMDGKTVGPEPLYTPHRIEVHKAKGHRVQAEKPDRNFWRRN